MKSIHALRVQDAQQNTLYQQEYTLGALAQLTVTDQPVQATKTYTLLHKQTLDVVVSVATTQPLLGQQLVDALVQALLLAYPTLEAKALVQDPQPMVLAIDQMVHAGLVLCLDAALVQTLDTPQDQTLSNVWMRAQSSLAKSFLK